MNLDPLAAIDLPLDDEVARTFWEGVQAGRLVLPRCDACGRWQWYPTETGPCCAGGALEWVEIAGTGTVFTFTVVRHPFLPELTAALPLAVGLIDLDGAEGIRFVGLLDLEPPAIGARVRMRVHDAAGRRLPVFCADAP